MIHVISEWLKSMEGMITRLVEKPTIPKQPILVGLYKIREAKSLFEANLKQILITPINTRRISSDRCIDAAY